MRSVVLVGPELYPIPPIRGGAAELFIDQVARRLTDWRPLVICPADPELPPREERGQVEYRRIPLAGWRGWLYRRYRQYFPFYDRQVAQIIGQVRPALVHVHNRPLLALYLKRRLPPGIPIILHMHNLYNSLGKRERPLPGTPMPVAGFVACSRFVLERERDRLGLGAALHRVVYNGVDPESFLSLWDHEDERRGVREQYQIADEPTVLFVGKLRESKGVHILLAAMERVWQEAPGTVLALVGGTEYGRGRTMRQTRFFQQLRRQLDKAGGRVVLTGFIPPARMPLTYLLGDIFVGPSQIEEGLGLVFLEAAAAGLPVIASRMGGIPEIVRDGQNGLLLQKKDDAQELAGKIVFLLKDEDQRKKLGQQGRQWALTNFSWEKIARTLEKVYDEVGGGD
ncbi:MAG: glycosyltransferase family 4 protein [Desulfobaccales bacterium]|nr:glycosyltransferase family 4 protein [Desulfobaccales bacterium]